MVIYKQVFNWIGKEGKMKNIQFHEVHELLIEDFHSFVQDHEFFHLNDVEFLDFHLNLVQVFLVRQLIPK